MRRDVGAAETDAMADTSGLAELEALRSEWRSALLAAQAALQAEEGFLDEQELEARERQLRRDYETATAELRRFALDEGLPVELAQPFLPRRLARRMLGLPRGIEACLFELDGVLVGSTSLHLEAWSRTFGDVLSSRSERAYGRDVAPFDPQIDYPQHLEGRPRLDGVRAVLASRGIRLPEGHPTDPPGAETVHGLANRKNELLGLLLDQRGVAAFDGVRHYLELAHDAGIGRAVVSASAHVTAMLERSGLADLVDAVVAGEPVAEESPSGRPAPGGLLAACRKLHVSPQRAAVFWTTEAGVTAARAAGFAFVVGVDPTGEPDRLRRLRRAGADVAVRGLPDLLERAG